MGIKTDSITQMNSCHVEVAEKQRKRGWPEVLSVFAAYGAKFGIESAYIGTVGLPLYKNRINLQSKYSEFKDCFRSAGYTAYKNSGLREMGVDLPPVSEFERIRNEVIFYGKYFTKRKKMQFNKSITSALEGTNAFYDEVGRRVFVNMEKSPDTIFHEMGHALNYNTIGIGKLLSMLRPAVKLFPVILAITAIRKPKKDGEESETMHGKGLDFVKKNCTALTALISLPVLLEECLASIKGYKLAKAVLPKDALKAVNKLNGVAWLSYLGLTSANVLAIHVANKVRNMTARTD